MAETRNELDRIHIRELLVRCIVGFNDDERREKQDVLINITLFADLRKVCATDRIEDTINYKTVKKRVMEMAEESRFLLIEALAGEIARVCLRFDGVERVKVSVDKPGALRYARSVAVEIDRVEEKDV